MTFDPQKPKYTLSFNEKHYELEGSFALIEAVESALKDSFLKLAVRTVNGMPASEFARLLSTILRFADEKLTPQQVGEILWNQIGVGSDEYTALTLHIYSFMSICVAKPSERKEVARKAGELLGKIHASPGSGTDASA